MQNESQYLTKKINEHFKALNPENDPHKAVWLISVDSERYESKAGHMVAAYVGHKTTSIEPIPPNVFTAPRVLAEGTHRLATEQEIEAHFQSQAKLREQLRAEEAARKVPFDIKVQQDPDLMKLVMAMAEKLVAQRAEETKTEKKGK